MLLPWARAPFSSASGGLRALGCVGKRQFLDGPGRLVLRRSRFSGGGVCLVMAAQPSWNKVLSGLHHLAVLCSAGCGGPVGLELTRITAPTGDSDKVGSGVPGGIVEAKATMPWRNRSSRTCPRPGGASLRCRRRARGGGCSRRGALYRYRRCRLATRLPRRVVSLTGFCFYG